MTHLLLLAEASKYNATIVAIVMIVVGVCIITFTAWTEYHSGKVDGRDEIREETVDVGKARKSDALICDMRGNDKTKPFVCSYHHDDCDWSLTIHAYDWQDAEARCKKLGYLRLDGELIAAVPVRLGILVRVTCWLKNFFQSISKGVVTAIKRNFH